jgi:predicted neutral ceramidase superfamily lipid hydrolase
MKMTTIEMKNEMKNNNNKLLIAGIVNIALLLNYNHETIWLGSLIVGFTLIFLAINMDYNNFLTEAIGGTGTYIVFYLFFVSVLVIAIGGVISTIIIFSLDFSSTNYFASVKGSLIAYMIIGTLFLMGLNTIMYLRELKKQEIENECRI